MKRNLITYISIRIIALFGVAMALSFIPEHYHSFFGDWHCEGGVYDYSWAEDKLTYKGCIYSKDTHHETWHWGYRHWLYLSMGICLSIVQIADIFTTINKHIK